MDTVFKYQCSGRSSQAGAKMKQWRYMNESNRLVSERGTAVSGMPIAVLVAGQSGRGASDEAMTLTE